MAKYEITIEVSGSLNTKTVITEIPDEDLEDLGDDERELEIDAFVTGEVLENHVYWNWKALDG
jgi:hypothetical protein